MIKGKQNTEWHYYFSNNLPMVQFTVDTPKKTTQTFNSIFFRACGSLRAMLVWEGKKNASDNEALLCSKEVIHKPSMQRTWQVPLFGNTPFQEWRLCAIGDFNCFNTFYYYENWDPQSHLDFELLSQNLEIRNYKLSVFPLSLPHYTWTLNINLTAFCFSITSPCQCQYLPFCSLP